MVLSRPCTQLDRFTPCPGSQANMYAIRFVSPSLADSINALEARFECRERVPLRLAKTGVFFLRNQFFHYEKT